ncbi:uncharacterized protein LOC110843030 isoform X5 [Folsomia candida]|uniref:uncharacterized protein LOC110843030 isoform X5 n=1 Tax=Folsomia candida TaxID=158441 RepID=UPI00160535D0|nr:uncharacterized protein LOC110843030 isoform X5 [Folsomia candida]
MSYLLNHIDNNRSEDDHINRIFPKCKPRASSLSLSPSLQHVTTLVGSPSSYSTTYASDLCLTSTNYSPSPNSNLKVVNNSNNLSPQNANNSLIQYSNRRHSSNSNQFNDGVSSASSSQQSLWNPEEFTVFSSHQTQLINENNNPAANSDNYSWTNSFQTLNHSEHALFSHSTTDPDPPTTPGFTPSKNNNCESHTNNHQKTSTKVYHKCDRNKSGNISSSILPNYQPRSVSECRSSTSQTSKASCGVSESNLSSVISSHKPPPNDNVGLCSAKPVTAAAHEPILLGPSRKMEHNSVEDNFDNGIGSGCSRSSGESTHSTSDFSLVSPVANIRDRVASGTTGGIKGHTNLSSQILPSPSMGSLRDSRIEIAGGREVYSQNRIRANRRHRGSSHTISAAEMMAAETAPSVLPVVATKMRKKSLHSHTPYYQHQQQHHHCCPHHSNNQCCGSSNNTTPTASSNNCTEVVLPPHGLVWEPNNHTTCRRATEVLAGSRQQYLSHSQSFGGTTAHINCTGGATSCGCCGHAHGNFDYPKVVSTSSEFDENHRICRNIPKLNNSSPTSPLTLRETVFASEVRSIEKLTARGPQAASGVAAVADKKCSSLLHGELESPCRTQPVIYEAVVGDGKVVFDDIGEWQEQVVADTGGYDGGDEHDTSVESQSSKKRQIQAEVAAAAASSVVSKDKKDHLGASAAAAHTIQRSNNKRSTIFGSNNVMDPSECSPCASHRDGNTTPSGYESDECSASVCTNTSILSTTNFKTISPNCGTRRLIGNIPIAEYDMSPKRYGLKQSVQPVTTHFDLIDVDLGVAVSRENDQVINDSNPQTLLDQTIAAATSSSSSSLDNTNTNDCSNSSSRTNNRISPSLSPSQPVSSFSARFPGFPQRVNSSSSSTPSQENTRSQQQQPQQHCPFRDYSESNLVAGTNHELLSSVHVDLPTISNSESHSISSNKKNGEMLSEASYLGYMPSMTANISTTTTSSNTDQLVRIEASSSSPSRPGGSLCVTSTTAYSQPHSSSLDQQQHASSSSLHCNLLEDNFMTNPTQVVQSSATNPRNQDFLYEFSETRKVLEEFFNVGGGENQSICRGGSGHFLSDKASFDELDYMLKRQTGNSYVGSRLASDIAGNLLTESSPKKPPRRGVLLLGSSDGDGSDEKGSPKLISFQEISLPQLHSPHQQYHSSRTSQSLTTCSSSSARSPRSSLNKTHSRSQSQSPPPQGDPGRDINDNDIEAETASTNTETDLGETEVGLQVGRGGGRNFALSPETTDDCDSNELESELSLDYEASLHSSCRTGGPVSRPVVMQQHGLSSGNESENEDIIEVDVEFQEDHCYLMGGSNIKSGFTKRQADTLPDAKLYREDNKENILDIVKPDNGASDILSWSNSDDLIANIHQDENKINSVDPNPTLMLMKKQISEIEKEIQMRASQQSHKSQPNGGGATLVDTEIEMNDQTELPETASNNSHGLNNIVGGSSSGRLNGPYQLTTAVSRKNPFSQPEDSMNDGGQETVPANHDPELDALDPMRPTPPPSPAPGSMIRDNNHYPSSSWNTNPEAGKNVTNFDHQSSSCTHTENRAESICIAGNVSSSSGGMQPSTSSSPPSASSVTAVIQDIKEAIQKAKPLPQPRHSSASTSTPIAVSTPCSSSYSRSGLIDVQQSPGPQERVPLICDSSPVWVPRNPRSGRNRDPRVDSQGAKDPLLKKQRYDAPEDDANTDTDTETDRLLGQTRTEDDCGFFDEKKDWKKPKSRTLLPSLSKGVVKSATSPSQAPLLSTSASIAGGGSNSISSNSFNTTAINNSFANANNVSSTATINSSSQHLIHPLSPSTSFDDSQVQLAPSIGSNKSKKQEKDGAKKKRSKEVLIEGVLFRARYLGSTQLTCEGQPTKATRMMQAEEAVSRIKAESKVTSEWKHGPSPPPPHISSKIASGSPSISNPPSVAKELENSTVCSLNVLKNVEDGGSAGNGCEDAYDYGPEEEDASCSDGESVVVDENLFDNKADESRGPVVSLQDNKGTRLPLFEDIHGSSNDSKILDDRSHPLSLSHIRKLSNGETCLSGGVSPPTTFLNLSPLSTTALPGTMFRLRFVGSIEVDEEIGSGKRRRKRPKTTTKKIMVEEAVMKMKSMAPEGETQPSTEVDLFISTEKIMVLNTDLKEIMMDHALRTISYIADIGDLVVLMARRRPVPTDPIDDSKPARLPKMICHVFESDDAQFIAQSIGQAFQVAYMEFLKANGIEDSSFVREMDYQEVLNSQEIFGDELQMFAKKELQKEVVVPKSKGEILGVVIVESGWGSLLPTVVIANLAPAGASLRCGQLNIGDQIIAINGVSLVGLPLSTCQNYIKNTRNQTVVKLTVVPCPPVVEVKIKRPDTKYQLGFSVQNGVICSLLRGGIAERGGVRVGHRIIEINSQSVVAVPHEKIVNLLATSVGEINMKTMPTSMFRLLTGQENPLYI